MTDPVLIDTDVAVQFVHSLPSKPSLSVLTIAELYRGVRDGRERMELDALVGGSNVLVLDLDMAVGGGLHQRKFGKSHGSGLADALIAATAERYQVTLVTLNRKHFPMLTEVLVPYVKA